MVCSQPEASNLLIFDPLLSQRAVSETNPLLLIIRHAHERERTVGLSRALLSLKSCRR